MTGTRRRPPGTPTGGQYAPDLRHRPTVQLEPPAGGHPAVAPRPDIYNTDRFTTHGRAFLAAWLADFTWAGQPVADSLAEIAVRPEHPDLPDEQPAQVTEEPWVSLYSTLGVPHPPPFATGRDADLAGEAATDPFHEAWEQALNGYRLAGTWLHPDVRWSLDPYEWATTGGILPIGTLDRLRPDLPRKFNPDLDPTSYDLGVVNFPIRAQYRIPELLSAGHLPDEVCRYVIGAALADAGVHEALEMLQDSSGRPAWDPHDRRYWLAVRTTFADGVVLEGSAH